MENILISGGSGLVGKALIPVLRSAGHQAVAIGRPYTLDSLDGATTIINLAGENLSARRWTLKQKRKIIASRVNTLNSLRELLLNGPHTVKTLISASAVGYYGSNTSYQIFKEDDPPGTDFLSTVCRKWESAADSFQDLGIRVVKVRIGVVLSEKGGALPKMMMPLKFGISVPLGSGHQWIPWIYLDDLVRVFLYLSDHQELAGAFNAVAPNQVTNSQFMKHLAIQNHRLFIPIGVPARLLRALLGEMAVITLQGSRVSPIKLLASGFQFQSPDLQ